MLTAGLGRVFAMRPCSYEGEFSATVLPMSLHASFVKAAALRSSEEDGPARGPPFSGLVKGTNRTQSIHGGYRLAPTARPRLECQAVKPVVPLNQYYALHIA